MNKKILFFLLLKYNNININQIDKMVNLIKK